MKHAPLSLLAALFLLPASAMLAAPSGGPYGPVQRHYTVPANAGHVYYVAPDGLPAAAGTDVAGPTSLAAALERVVTGDAIILRGGTYRTGGLLLNQSITLQPYGDEQPVIKGTEVATQWEQLREGVWRTKWSHLFPSKPRPWWNRAREGMRTPLHRFNDDMVFVDGVQLQSAGWAGELDGHSFYIDYDAGEVYIRTDPTTHLVEITAWNSALVVTPKPCHGKTADHRGPTIRGLTFTQYAYRALEVEGKRGSVPSTEEPTDDPVGMADPATFGKEVVGTTIEDCAITHCSRVAGYFRGDHLTIRHCLVSDTSTEGIYVIGSSDCLLEQNIIRRNNVEHLTGYYASAVKIFNQTRRVVCRDNLILDQPESNGVWYDVGNIDGVFVDNWVEGCDVGFMFEISKGVTCAGNVFVNCGRGTWILNSSNAVVAQNTFINAPATFERNGRNAVGDIFDWHATTGPAVGEREGHAFVNNLLFGGAGFAKPLLRVEQDAKLHDLLTRPQLTEVDGNVFVRSDSGSPLLTWSPGGANGALQDYASLVGFRAAHPEFSAHGRDYTDYHGPLFRSLELQRYQLMADFPGADTGVALPQKAVAALGTPAGVKPHPGAYAPTP